MEATEAKTAVQAEAVLDVFVPEPTADFDERVMKAAPPLPRPRRIPIPLPIPVLFGSRFLIWKQDPSVKRFRRRLAYIRGLILNGPRSFRIKTELTGTTPLVRNAKGDFVFFPAKSPEADCAHTFAVTHQALTMWTRRNKGKPIPWAWNAPGVLAPLTVYPRGFVGANAFYSRSGKKLLFGHFVPGSGGPEIFTCRSLDIVAHETGHAILDGLKPGWLGYGNPPQTPALHESFGDLTSVFLALSQLDQVDLFISLTKANPHDPKNFIAAVAEEFGKAFGKPYGLRNADNDLKLSDVSNQVHALSQVFTGAIYDILCDIFIYEWKKQLALKGPEPVMFEVARDVSTLLLEAIKKAPATGATYVDVATKMLEISKNVRNDPVAYRNFIRHRFAVREIILPAVPFVEDEIMYGFVDMGDKRLDNKQADPTKMKAMFADHPSFSAKVVPDYGDTCGTMQLPEYFRPRKDMDADLKKMKAGEEPDPEETFLAAEIKEFEKALA